MTQQGFSRRYLDELDSVLKAIDAAAVDRAIACLREARDADRTIFSCGNGGSASIASQMVVDMVKGASYRKMTRPFRMISLTDSVATITAYANDVSYESVFVEPLRNWAQKGDVLIAISGSGNSPNVLRAVEFANGVGCTTIGLTTGSGGRLKDLVTLPLSVPSSHMGRLEDAFFIMTHILCYAFMEDACG
ncbi:MAG TPA: SIS domain-containing protein [Phycisphaerae bacterium]|nr:SIS domain-containing protein [Phycisphaerae bacterium]HRR85532.1 SIS domain-containing protein [Phycisphaerae bacterium]